MDPLPPSLFKPPGGPDLPFGVRLKMTMKILAVILVFSFGHVLSQYNAIYLGSNLFEVPYEKTRQEILNNFYNNKPLLNYVPVYNTDYGHWISENQTIQEDPFKNSQFTCQLSRPEVTLQKLGQDVARLTTNMQTLSHKTNTAYEGKLKELNEVKKLNDDLKVALQTADVLRNGLREQEKLLLKNVGSGCPVMDPAGLEQVLKMIEGLESTVRNVNYKFVEK